MSEEKKDTWVCTEVYGDEIAIKVHEELNALAAKGYQVFDVKFMSNTCCFITAFDPLALMARMQDASASVIQGILGSGSPQK